MLRLLVALPFLVLLAVFALSNPQQVQFGLWPTDLSLPVSLATAVLAPLGAGFLAGALVVWAGAVGGRLRARRAEQAAQLLEAQVAELKAELSSLRQLSVRPAPGAPASELAGTWRG